MGASSQSNAIAQKDSGPSGSDQPGKVSADCPLNQPPPVLAQTAEPKVTVNDAQRDFYGKAAPKRDQVGSVTLKTDVSGDPLGYKEGGTFTTSNANCQFYSDAACKKKISSGQKYKHASLSSGVTVYYKGTLDGSTQVKLTLDAAKDGRITVRPPADGDVQSTLIPNNVKPELTIDKTDLPLPFPELDKVDEEIHTFQPKKQDLKAPVAKVTVSCTADIELEAYDKTATVSFDNANVTVWLDADCKKQGAAPLTVSNADIRKGFSFWLRGETAGDTEVSLTLGDTDKLRAVVDTAAKKATLKVQAVNRVTPYLKVEHLVVLKDLKLADHQRKDDSLAGSAAADAAAQIRPDPTRVELSALDAKKAPAYTGKALLVCTPANVDAFEDEACTKPFDLSTKIDFDKLTGAKPHELYLRGKAEGKFTAELKLDPSNDALILVDDETKGEMGCVELKMKLFHFLEPDVNQAIEPDVKDIKDYWKALKKLKFEQKEMTDAERAGTGRMLQVQKDAHMARAKFTLEVDAEQWPDAAKDYKLRLDAADADKPGKKRSGAIKVFDKEEKGSEITLPKNWTQKEVAKLKPLWVEGSTRCDGWRGIRLSVGFDRPDGGPAKTEKLDGNWAAFTVVQIKEVKCDFDNEAGKEKFVDGKKLFINLDANGRVLKTVGGNRKAEVTATLEPALKDVDVYFSIVENAGNYKLSKGISKDFREGKLGKLKETVKAVDRPDRKKLLNVTVKTDDHGVAKIETLQTPQFGLLKFKVGAYLLINPKQACYADDHSDLKKHAPTLNDDWWEVWRRTFFKVVAMKRFGGASYIDRFDQDALVNKLEEVGMAFERVGAPITKDYECAQPDFLAWTRSACGGQAPDRTLYLGLINGRGDDGVEDRSIGLGSPGGKTASWNLGYVRVESTNNKAQYLKSCEFKHGTTTTDMTAHVTLTQEEDFKFKLDIDFNSVWTTIRQAALLRETTAGTDAGEAATIADEEADGAMDSGTAEIVFNQTKSSSGVSWYEAVIVCMDSREPKHSKENAKNSATHTFMHEIGHYLSLGAKYMPDHEDTVNPNFYSEVAGEKSKRGKGGYGQGPHCDAMSDKCALWYMFAMTFEYCDTCKLMMRAHPYHDPGAVDARAVF